MSVILVVDDRPTNRQFLVTLLGYCAHRLLEASDGSEALELTRTHHPDLVITDILMPTMDGLEFVRRLRAEPVIARTPVIFYTAVYREREARVLAQAAGIEEVIAKPSDPQAVLDTVSRALGAGKAPLFSDLRPQPPDTVTQAFLQTATDLSGRGDRLSLLIESGLDLGSERDPAALLRNFCCAAQDIVGAACSVVEVPEEGGKRFSHFFAHGMSPTVSARISGRSPEKSVIGPLLAGGQAVRLDTWCHDPCSLQFLPLELNARSLLAVALASPARVYGWVYLINKLGVEAFTAEDERLLMTLAAQVTIAYENLALDGDLRRHAAALEREVAERRRAEEQLKMAAEGLRRSNADLQQFANVASHDLQEPLRAVTGCVQVLQRRYQDRLDSSADELIGYVVDGTHRMQTLLQDLLTYSQVQSRVQPFHPVDCSTLFDFVLANLSVAIQENGAVITHDPLPTVTADSTKLTQLLQNLVANAIKFRGAGAPHVHVAASRDGDEWVFSVRDDGIGIDPAYFDRIFGVFQRLHARTEYPGTGIGLAICKKVVEHHRGRIWIESELAKGATFYFTLPCGDCKRSTP